VVHIRNETKKLRANRNDDFKKKNGESQAARARSIIQLTLM
jgi:hypothetical protein